MASNENGICLIKDSSIVGLWIINLFHWCTFTLSVHSESRKTEQVTMKANFIYFWSVKSEFVIINSIFPCTSELAWIWHFLRKLDYFWALLYWQHCYKTEQQFFVTSVASTRVLKNSSIFSKNAKFTLTSTLQIYMKFAFIVTCLVFLDSEWITDNLNLVESAA